MLAGNQLIDQAVDLLWLDLLPFKQDQIKIMRISQNGKPAATSGTSSSAVACCKGRTYWNTCPSQRLF